MRGTCPPGHARGDICIGENRHNGTSGVRSPAHFAECTVNQIPARVEGFRGDGQQPLEARAADIRASTAGRPVFRRRGSAMQCSCGLCSPWQRWRSDHSQRAPQPTRSHARLAPSAPITSHTHPAFAGNRTTLLIERADLAGDECDARRAAPASAAYNTAFSATPGCARAFPRHRTPARHRHAVERRRHTCMRSKPPGAWRRSGPDPAGFSLARDARTRRSMGVLWSGRVARECAGRTPRRAPAKCLTGAQ